MDINSVDKYLNFLNFKKSKIGATIIYSLGKYQIMFSNDFYRRYTMYMYYDNTELYSVQACNISTQDIMYTLVNVFELGVENMNNRKEKIIDSICIKRLKKYIEASNGITLHTSDRTSFVVNDKNVLFILDDSIIVHAIKRDEKINQILDQYHFNNEEPIGISDNNKYFNKFFELKSVLDNRINEERLIKNVLFDFTMGLTNIGFKSYKNHTIFKYTDDIRIVIKDKTVELYYFGHKQNFSINGHLLVNILDTINSIEFKRK